MSTAKVNSVTTLTLPSLGEARRMPMERRTPQSGPRRIVGATEAPYILLSTVMRR